MAGVNMDSLGLTLTGLVLAKKIEENQQGNKHRVELTAPGHERNFTVLIPAADFPALNVGGIAKGIVTYSLYNGRNYWKSDSMKMI